MYHNTIVRFCIICLTLIYSTQNNATNISQTEAKADIDSFVNALKEIHPDLFFSCKEQTFNENLANIHNQLTCSYYNPIELYRILQPLTTLLGDGHTQLYFPKNVLIEENPSVFPLLIEINTNDSTFWLKEDFKSKNVTLKKGTQILSINGNNYSSLVKEMLPYCGGERLFFRLSKVNRDFVHFLYMLHPSNSFTVCYRFENKQKECNLKAIPYQKYVEKTTKQTSSQEAYQFNIIDNKTALITFNAFTDLGKFKSFADSMFSQLQKQQIKHLIIDLRMNGGGDSNIGDELFQYISDRPFVQFEQFITRYSSLQKKLAKENFGTDYFNHENGIDSVTNLPLIPLRPNPFRFKEKITLLISHTTFSSASAFAWAFQKMNRGTIIGEESGGMSICFGDVVIYQLPHSNIASTISFARVFLYKAKENDIHGVLPDIEIPQEQALDFVLKNSKGTTIRN